MDRRSTVWHVDWVLVLGVVALSFLGSLLIWSATHNRTSLTGGKPDAYLVRHALNFAIGQGDTTVTPLQLATVYAALSNGGTLYEPRVVQSWVGANGKPHEIKPVVKAKLPVPRNTLKYIDTALKQTTISGTAAWKFQGFPLDKIPVRAKTGTAEVYGKQTTSWLASYTDRYAVVMMISQAGTGSGAGGDAVRKIYETLYNIKPAPPTGKEPKR